MISTDYLSSEKWQRLKEIFLVGLLGGFPPVPGRWLRSLLYRNILVRQMGKSVRIERGSEFLGSHRLKIGTNVHIGSHVCLDASYSGSQIIISDGVWLSDNIRLFGAGFHGKIFIGNEAILDRGIDIKAHDDGKVEIGRHTYIGPYVCIAGPGPVKIGNECLIASHTSIYGNNHNFADPTDLINMQGTTSQGVVIEDDCWIGSGVRILDGVTIGYGSVIGAGAVVTKDIPPFSIAVGVPAKVIGHRGSQTVLPNTRNS